MSGYRERFRFVVVRERRGPWWRRWRWAVEDSWYPHPTWRLKKSGFAWTLPNVFEKLRGQLPQFELERLEGEMVVERTPIQTRPAEATPLPPELLATQQGESS